LKKKKQKNLFFFILIEGQIIESDEDIIAENVPIITPNGDIIVDSLSLKVKFFKLKHSKNSSIILFSDHTSYACFDYWTQWLW